MTDSRRNREAANRLEILLESSRGAQTSFDGSKWKTPPLPRLSFVNLHFAEKKLNTSGDNPVKNINKGPPNFSKPSTG